MKIFVAGGAGYIGSVCSEYLLDHGHEVTIFDSLVTGHSDAVDSRAKFIKGDLIEKECIMEAIRGDDFEAVMHFAAYSQVGESMQVPSKYFRNNVCGGLNLADAAVANNVRIIVFSSTAAIFGEPDEIPIREDASQVPINPYGESKLAFEKILRWYHEVHGLQYVALRYFNASGATGSFGEDHSPETHLIPIVLQVAQNKRDKIMVFGGDYDTPDGTCIRDYIHILDLAQAHMLALNSSKSGHFNLGTGNGLSVKEIIETSREITGHSIPAEIVERRPGDPPQLIACSDRAKSELGWKPQLEDAGKIIESAWKWTCDHPAGYQN